MLIRTPFNSGAAAERDREIEKEGRESNSTDLLTSVSMSCWLCTFNSLSNSNAFPGDSD